MQEYSIMVQGSQNAISQILPLTSISADFLTHTEGKEGGQGSDVAKGHVLSFNKEKEK